jgi:hypothetical protein
MYSMRDLVLVAYIRQPMRHWDGAKRRAGAKWSRKLRPYDRSRCAEHVGKSRTELAYRGGVPAPPEVVMVAPPTLLSDASMA